jgi:hypothetical protein
MEPGHKAGQNGHHSQVRTGRAPDGHILAWLRERARMTGQVPGRRQVIEKWALGSTRAERLRGIVIDEAASDPLQQVNDWARPDRETHRRPIAANHWARAFAAGAAHHEDRGHRDDRQ